jgi:hypothetical protein
MAVEAGIVVVAVALVSLAAAAFMQAALTELL